MCNCNDVGEDAFKGCSSLKYVYYPSDMKDNVLLNEFKKQNLNVEYLGEAK